MKVKVFVILFVFVLAFPGQVALTKKLQSEGKNSYRENSVSPLAGLVTIVDLKLIDNIPTIIKITVIPGRYNERRKNAAIKNSSNHNRKPQLSVLDGAGNVIYKTEFDFPRLITIPPLPPEYFDPYTPAVIPIEEPEVTFILPYFQEAAFLEVSSSDGILTSAMPIDQMISPFNLLPPEPPPIEMGKFHVLIMASNYNSSNMAKFISVANSIKQLSLTIEPFSTFSSKVDIHMYTNTADLGCYSGCSGISRLICCDSSKVISAAASSGYLYDEIIVIHNTPNYGGGGYRESGDSYKNNSYNTYVVVYGGTDFSIDQDVVALHEFGHSFGNLCDEYFFSSEGYIYKECVNCRANCNDWISITTVCQAGCDAKSEYFRPEDSIMIYLSLPYYNQASIKATYFPDGLEKRLKFFVKIIFPPMNFKGEKVLNRSLSQAEYINVLSWKVNPNNENNVKYRIYEGEGENKTAVVELSADTFEYWHRRVDRDKQYIYALCAVNNDNEEGEPAYVTVQ